MSDTRYTPAECAAIRDNARKLGMDADPRFWTATPTELSKILNGCGPDSWTDSARSLATWVYRNFPEQIAIHDFDFQHSDGKPESLVKVNARFDANGAKKRDWLYPLSKFWLAPLRAWSWTKLQVASVALRNGSEEAWQSAHERFQEAC